MSARAKHKYIRISVIYQWICAFGAFMCLVASTGCAGTGRSSPAANPARSGQAQTTSPHPPRRSDISEPEHLTRDAINKLPDDLLEQGVATWVEYKLRNSVADEEAAVMKLPRGLRMIYTTINVESEVDNGGWNQYFWNTRMVLNQAAISDFEMIGAAKYADLMRRAVSVGELEETVREPLRRIGTPEAFSQSYDRTHLQKFDEEFYRLSKVQPLTKLRVAYIRTHPDQFISKN